MAHISTIKRLNMIVKIRTEDLVKALDKLSDVQIQRVRVIDNIFKLECGTVTRDVACEFEGATVWYPTLDSAWKNANNLLHHITERYVKLEIKTNYLDLIVEL